MTHSAASNWVVNLRWSITQVQQRQALKSNFCRITLNQRSHCKHLILTRIANNSLGWPATTFFFKESYITSSPKCNGVPQWTNWISPSFSGYFSNQTTTRYDTHRFMISWFIHFEILLRLSKIFTSPPTTYPIVSYNFPERPSHSNYTTNFCVQSSNF